MNKNLARFKSMLREHSWMMTTFCLSLRSQKCQQTWCLIHKAHLRFWLKFWKLSCKMHTILCSNIRVFIFECLVWIKMVNIRQKYYFRIISKSDIFRSEILYKLGVFVRLGFYTFKHTREHQNTLMIWIQDTFINHYSND
jgi:hypothetical protein